MTKNYTSNPKQKTKQLLVRLTLVVVSILVVASVIWTVFLKTAEMESVYTILKDKVLANKEFLKDARILSQQKDDQQRDSYLSLHAILTSSSAEKMSKQDTVIKECVGTSKVKNCTVPTWISYADAAKDYPTAIPTIAENKSNIKCTSYWATIETDGSLNNQDVLCLNRNNGELWYVFSKV